VSEWVTEGVNERWDNATARIMASNMHGIVSVRLETNILHNNECMKRKHNEYIFHLQISHSEIIHKLRFSEDNRIVKSKYNETRKPLLPILKIMNPAHNLNLHFFNSNFSMILISSARSIPIRFCGLNFYKNVNRFRYLTQQWVVF
jgi:hypothetical protein